MLQPPVGSGQLAVGFRQFLGSPKNFGLHLLGPGEERMRGVFTLLLEANEFRHIFDAIKDINDLAFGVHYRRIDGCPISFFEFAALRLRPADVIFLNGHRVGLAGSQNGFQGFAEQAGPRGLRIAGIVREHVKHVPADDLVSRGHGRAEMCVAGRDDFKGGGQDQLEALSGFKQQAEINCFRVPFRFSRRVIAGFRGYCKPLR